MKEKMMIGEKKALEMAAKYICNLRDGLCPMVVENYRCLSDCGPETLPWRCWIDHFLAASGAKEGNKAQADPGRALPSRTRPRSKRWGFHRPAADREW